MNRQLLSTFQRTPEVNRSKVYGTDHEFVTTNRECISCDDIFVPDDQLQCFTCRQACTACRDLSGVDGEYPGELHEGKALVCGECNAEYYEEWMSERRYAGNLKARMNHPELAMV